MKTISARVTRLVTASALALGLGALAATSPALAQSEFGTVGTGTGLNGAYYNNKDHTDLRFARTDPTINFVWGGVSPGPGIDPTTFSVRWSGRIEAQYSEKYKICVDVDDGVRLWLNGEQLLDEWRYQRRKFCSEVKLISGNRYPLVLEYFQQDGPAVIKLTWSSPSTPEEIIPQSQLYPMYELFDPCPPDDGSAPAALRVEPEPVMCPDGHEVQ